MRQQMTLHIVRIMDSVLPLSFEIGLSIAAFPFS
jgi:hypothetical protein